MHREISDLEQRLQSLRHAAGTAVAAVLSKAGIGTAARPTRRRGRPAGSGKKAAAAAATPAAATGAVKRGPGRPPGSGKKRGPGRPKGSSKAAAAPAANAAAPSTASAAPAKRGRKRRSAITPEQLASRQLQGRYLGLIRQVPANKRAQYQKIAKEKGREAAIRELQDATKK
jgi:O6-methylguanine-DNA--protein-cysteine methyltransferase